MTDEKKTDLATRIQVENLVVNPREKRELAIGDMDSFERIAKDTIGIQAVLWNEEYIAMVTKDPSTIITFRPEFNPSVAMFFMRENKRESYAMNGAPVGVRVWEGDYEPVKFTKANLLKFIKQYGLADNAPLIESVQEMKITESKTRTEKMISLDDDNFQATEEQILKTNIPTKFSLDLPLIQSPETKAIVTLAFEAMSLSILKTDTTSESSIPIAPIRPLAERGGSDSLEGLRNRKRRLKTLGHSGPARFQKW
ncbi:MAG: hypothetical protein KGI38_11330 [Thaumarchaeota archaeon]|nr:hypothetical protein [Nitrososphaerota archaeon]